MGLAGRIKKNMFGLRIVTSFDGFRTLRAVAFSEIPPFLGLPSIYSGYWEPFFAAAAETGTVVCMHIGSGTKTPQTSDDAPDAVLVDLKTSVPETPRRALASPLWHRARVRLRGTSFVEQPNPSPESLQQVDAFSVTAASGDPFGLQDRVATWAAGVLAMRLNGAERQTLTASGTRAPGFAASGATSRLRV